MPRTPFLSTARPVNPQPAPTLGQHTEEVLREVTGLPSPEVDSLFETGIAAGARSEKPTYAGRPSAPPTKQAGRRLTPRQPLEGVRILDFCWAIAGPLSTRLLADLGADVIKVESEYRTDPIRYIGVQPESITSFHTNGQFNDCNTNKRAFTLNLNTPQGIELVRKLATTADVVISNYTPDRLDRWGLSYETLNELRPNVIVANLAVMGTHGPHKGWRSYGNGIVAMCGLGDRTGFPDKEPIGLGTLHTDFTVPYFAATHVLAALIERNRTGKGQYLELAQYEASVHLLDTELMEQLNNGCLPDRAGNRSVHLAPHGAFPAVGDDKWIAIACRDDEDWRQLSGIPGLEALATVTDRRANEAAVEATLSDWTKQRDAWEASRELQEAGIPASPVEDLHDLLHRDAAMQSDFRETAIDDGITAMVQEQPILWDGHRLPIERAPRWSEHTEEVLKELGVDDHRIADLAAANVLF